MTLATGLPALAAYAATAKGAGALLRSDVVANKLIQNSLGQTAPMTGGLTNQLLRSAAPAITPRQPIQITVRGGNPLLGQ